MPNLYTLHITLYDVFFFGMICIGVNFAFLLWFGKSINRSANRFLALALLTMILWMLRILAIDIHLQSYLPGWDRLPMESLLALGPLIYFYVLKITRPEYKFGWKDLAHFSPLLLEQGALALEIKESIRTGATTYATPIFHVLNPILQLLIFISIITYLYRSYQLIQNFYRRMQPVLMDRSLVEFRWLRRLMAATALLWVLWIVYAAVDYLGYRDQLGIHVYYPFYIFFAIIIIWTAAAAFLRPQAGTLVQSSPILKPTPVELKGKGTWLKKTMEANGYHKDPELSLSSLAGQLDIHPHELSRIINAVLKKSFNDFINEYRVRDVISKMQDPAYDRITLLGMAFDAGFNSKATFIRAFKQLTGENPAEYKRRLEKEVANDKLQPLSPSRQVILVPEVPSWSREQLNYNFMFRNYFKIAWRNMLKNKFYAIINIIGLSAGLTFGLLILLWVNDEFSFDAFNTKAERIYKINAQIGTGTSRQTWSGIPGPIAMRAVKDVPEVENSVRINKNDSYSVYRYKDKLLSAGDHGAYVVDASLFKIFNFKLLKGNVNNPFPDIHSIIVTETTARRFFGNDDPIGKVLLGNSKDNFTVTGVIADFPENSSFKADMLFSFELAKKNYRGNAYWKSLEQDWGDYFYDTYLLIKPGTSAKVVADKLTAIHIANQKDAAQSKLQYVAEPLLHLHLYNTDGAPAGLQTARIFLIVAVLILIIACINYVNLSTARAMLRSKEVSVRKIIGAERRQLFGQFIVETTLFFVVAVVLSLIAVKLLMPVYNTISGKQMQFDLLDRSIWKVIIVTVIGSLLASSIYPALLLSSFKPINALKGKLSLGVGNVLFRKGLVVTQFIFSIVLIIGTLIIRQQLKYIQEKDLGYDKSHVFGVDMGGIYGHYDAVRAELMSQPGVVDVTRAGDNIVNINGATGDTDWDGKDSKQSFMIHPLNVDGTYVKFFKLKIVAGRGFLGGKADSANFILNETAVREAGIKDPIGKRFTLWQTRGTIIGVVKDFHFASLKQKIEPAVLCDAPQNCGTIFIKTTGIGASQAIKTAEKEYKAYNPIVPYSYEFLDSDYDALYKTDMRSGMLFSIFAGIAIFISCLGLLGLSTYTAQVKVKEIGIRKVLGASVANITGMLSTDFLKLVGLSIVIATPIAWYAMHKWLQDYAYPVEMHWWVFALSGISAIIIAFITISFQAIKAALANPVKSLRSE